MDWAASEWKQNLPHSALQKINALEEQVERFQKERQQKQFQIESLEQNLQIQKRKLEDEKVQKSHLLREQQSLAETCGNLEQKVQKLTQEIQTKDNRVNCLEGQLVQAKKQVDIGSSKVTELEKTVADLHCAKNNSDGFSEGIASSQISQLEQKIKEQDELIKELREKLEKDKGEQFHVFEENRGSCQRRGGADVRNPYGRDAQTSCLWDTLGTPLRSAEKRKNRHHDPLDKSNTGNDNASEKIYSLEQKLKQITQELECQRHNSEAAKQALEQKFKEKESGYKQDIKQQAQALSDLDKEFTDTRMKLQQELTQALKTLDANAFQLDKAQQQKLAQEKELAQLHTTIRELETQCLSKEKMADELKNSMQNLDEAKSSLTSKLEYQECKSKELQQQLVKTENRLGQQEAEVEKLKYELDDKKQQLQELQGKLTLLTQQYNSSIQEFKTKSSLMEKENQQLTRSINEKNILIDDKENKIFSYQQQCDGLQNKISSLQQSLDSKEKNIARLEKDIKDSSTNVAEKERKLMSITEELTKMKALLQQQNEKCTHYNSELVQITKELESKNKQISQLNSNLSNKMEQVTLLEDQLKEHQDTLTKKEKLINVQQSDLKSFKENVKGIETKLQETEKLLKEKNNENYQLKNELQDMSTELKTKISLLEKELNDKKEQITVKEKEAETLSKNLKQQNNLLQSKQEKLEEVENQLEDTKDKLERALEINKENEAKQRIMESTLQEKIHQLEDSQKTSCLEIAKKEAEIKELESNLECKNDKISSLELKIAEETAETASTISHLEYLLKEKEQELLKYEDNAQQLTFAKQEIEALNDKLNTESTCLKKCQSDMSTLEDVMKKMNAEFEEALRDKQNAVEKIKTLEDVIAEKERQLSSMENELSVMSDNLQSKKLIVENSEVIITEKHAELEKNKEQIANLLLQEELSLTKLNRLETVLKEKDEKMNEELMKRKDNEEQIVTLNEKLKIQDDDLHKCQMEINTLKELLKGSNLNLEELAKKNESDVDKIQYLEGVVNEKEQAIMQLESKLTESHKESIQQLELLIVEKETQLKEYKQKLCEVTEHQELNANKIKELENALKSKDEEKELEFLSHKENQQKMTDLQEKITALSAEFAAKEDTIQNHLVEISELQETIIQTRTELEASMRDNQCKVDNIRHLEFMIDNKEKEIIQAGNEYNTIVTEFEKQKSAIHQYETIISDQEGKLNQYDREINNLTVLQENNCKKINHLESVLKAKDEQSDHELQKFKTLELQLANAKQQISILNERVASDEEKYTLEITILKENLDRSKMGFEEIYSDYNLKSEKIISLEESMKAKEEEIDQLKSKEAALLRNIDEQDAVIKQSKISITDKETQLEHYKEQFTNISKSQETALNKINELMTAIQIKDEQISELEHKVKLFEEEAKVHVKNVNVYLEEIEELKKKLDLSKEAIKRSQCHLTVEEQTLLKFNEDNQDNDTRLWVKEVPQIFGLQDLNHSEQMISYIMNLLKILTGKIQNLLQTSYNIENNSDNNPRFDSTLTKAMDDLMQKSKGNDQHEDIYREFYTLASLTEVRENEFLQLQDALSGATWLLTLKECLLVDNKENIEKLERDVAENKKKCHELSQLLHEENIKVEKLKKHGVIQDSIENELLNKDIQIKQLEEQLNTLSWSMEIKDGRLNEFKNEVIMLEKCLQEYESKNDVLQKELHDLTQEREKLNKQFNAATRQLEELITAGNNDKVKELEQILNNTKWLATMKECLIYEQREEIDSLKKTCEKQNDLLSAMKEKAEMSKNLDYIRHIQDEIDRSYQSHYSNEDIDDYNKPKRTKFSDESLETFGRKEANKKQAEKSTNTDSCDSSTASPKMMESEWKNTKLCDSPHCAERFKEQYEALKQIEADSNNLKWLLIMKECVISEQNDQLHSLKKTCEEQNKQIMLATKDIGKMANKQVDCLKHNGQTTENSVQNDICFREYSQSDEVSKALDSIVKDDYKFIFQKHEHLNIQQEVIAKISMLSDIISSMKENESKSQNKAECLISVEQHALTSCEVPEDYYLYRIAFEIIKETAELLKIVKTRPLSEVISNAEHMLPHSLNIECDDYNLQKKSDCLTLSSTDEKISETVLTPEKENERKSKASETAKLLEEEIRLDITEIKNLEIDIVKKEVELANLEKEINITRAVVSSNHDTQRNLNFLTLEEATWEKNTAAMIQEIKSCRLSKLELLCGQITSLRTLLDMMKEKDDKLGQFCNIAKQNRETMDHLNSKCSLLEKENQQLTSEAATLHSERNCLIEQNSELQKMCEEVTKQLNCSICKISEFEENFSKQTQMNEKLASQCAFLENVRKEHHEIYHLLEMICDIEEKILDCSRNETSTMDSSFEIKCEGHCTESDDKAIIETAAKFQLKLKNLRILIRELVQKHHCKSYENELVQLLETEKFLLNESLSEFQCKLDAASHERDNLLIELQKFKEGVLRYHIITDELENLLEEKVYNQRGEIKWKEGEIPPEIHSQIVKSLSLISDLSNQKQIAKSNVEKQQNIITQLEKSMEKIRTQDQALMSKVEEQHSTVTDLNKTVEELTKENNNLNAEIEQLHSNIAKLNETTKEIRIHESALMSQVEQQQEVIMQLNQGIEEVKKENATLHSQSKQQQCTIAQLNDTIEEIEENLQKLFEEKVECLEKMQALQEQCDKLSAQCCDLQGKLENAGDICIKSGRLEDANNELKSENQMLKVTSEQLQAQLTMLQDEVNKHLESEEITLELETKVLELQIKVEEREGELNSINEKYVMECNKVKELEEKILSLISSEEMISKELQITRDKCHDLESQNSCLYQDLTNHITALQKEKNNSQGIEKILADLRAEFQEKQEDFSLQSNKHSEKIASLTNKLQEVEVNLTRVSEERDALLKEREENEVELEKSWGKIKDIEQVLAAKEEELKFCKNKLDIALVDYEWNKQTWQNTSSSMKKQLISAEAKMQSLKCDLDAAKKRIEEQDNELQLKLCELKQVQSELQNKQEEVNLSEKQLNKVNSKVKELEENLSFCELKLNARIKTSEKEQNLILQLKTRIKSINEKFEKEKSNLQEQISKRMTAEEALNVAQCEYEKLKNEFAMLKTANEEKDKEMKLLLEEKMQKLENQNAGQLQLQTKLEQLEKEHEKLTAKLYQKTASNEALEELCKTLRANCQKLEKEISDLKAKFHSETNITIESLKEQLKEKTKQLEENESELAEVWVKYAESLQEGNSLWEECKYLKVKLQHYKEEIQQLKLEKQTEKVPVDENQTENRENVICTAEKASNLPSTLTNASDDVKRTSTPDDICPPLLTIKPRNRNDFPNSKRAQTQPSVRKRVCRENRPLSSSSEQDTSTKTIRGKPLSASIENKSPQGAGKPGENFRGNEKQQRLKARENISLPHRRKDMSSSNTKALSPTPLSLHNVRNRDPSVAPSPLSCTSQMKVLPSADDCKIQ